MKKFMAGLMVAGLVAFVGCSGTTGGRAPSGGSGGSGAAHTTGQKGGGLTGGREEFSIKPPLTSTHIKQGETKKVKITISRGADFKDDVTLDVEPPDGLTASVEPKVLKGPDNKEAEVTLTAKDNAPAGKDLEVKVTAKPEKGERAANTFKVTVEGKEAKPK
jgi:hypothetical protein